MSLQNKLSPAKAAMFTLHDHADSMASNLRKVLAQNPRTVQFVSVLQVTPVKLAAANKARNIYKVSEGNYYVSDSMETFVNAVRNAGNKDQRNSAEAVKGYETSQAWYEHDPKCAAIGYHRKTREMTLCYFFKLSDQPKSRAYYIDADTGAEISKAEVAELLTKGEREKLLNPPSEVHNKTNDVYHTVGVRAVYMKNVAQVTANGVTITV